MESPPEPATDKSTPPAPSNGSGAAPGRQRTTLGDVLRKSRTVREIAPALTGIARNVRAIRDAADQLNAKLCPVCGATFREFAAFKNRPHARCPSCNALERTRGSWLYLQRETPILCGDVRMLHVAPEAALKSKLERMINVDYVPTNFDPAKPDEGIDIQRMPMEDDSFDLIFCSHVLEHVPDDRAAMRELCRVLRPGGLAVILVPTRNLAATYEDASITTDEGRTKAFGRFDHLRIYGRDVTRRLREAGFEVTVDYFTDRLTLDERHRHGLVSEPIFACRKH